MTPAVVQSLQFAGITPPQAGSAKTTCPYCSKTRRKKREKCLSVKECRETGLVFLKCFHCGYDDAII